MKLNLTFRGGLALLILTLATTALAADWGTIKGRIVYKGTPPTPQKLVVNKDQAVCAKHPLVDESIVVSKDGGLANVFLYSREKDLPVHPD